MSRVAHRFMPRIGWLLFWSLAFLCLLIVFLFAYAALPVLFANTQGGHAHIWFFGNTGFVVLAAALYLAVAITVLVKKRSHGAARRLDS